MARKRKRVPEVLWRLFHHRARPLADTILALIPSECCCNGRGCLSCRRDKAMSFLVRPGDPSDYRKLLYGCFAVVAENAPPLPVFDPRCCWLQHEIVRRSIEMIMHEKPSSLNLICCSCNKDNHSSAEIDELTSSKWTVLLRRVGDALMIYLLKYTSLFLPLPQKKHHQITGYPISNFCFNLRRLPASKYQHHPWLHAGSRMKRKRVDGAELILRKQLRTYFSGFEPSDSIKLVVNNGSSCSSEKLSDKKFEGSSKEYIASSRKRTRQYRWQRQRKRRQLVQETHCLIPCGGNSCNGDNSATGLQNGVCTSSNQSDESVHMNTRCFCCSVFQNVPKMNKNAEIDRRNIFYRLDSSTSMFPRNHTLYALKPNGSGASVLFNDIFGAFGFEKNPGTMPCFHCKSSCLVIPTCLYHSLIKLLKCLIRKTQNCPYLKLLEKHCSFRSPDQDSSRIAGNEFEGNDSRIKLCVSRPDGNQSDEQMFLVVNAKNCEMISETTVDQVEPSKRYCPKKHVVSFIWAICRRIVPPPLLGEPSNWRLLRKNLSKFIQLRKYEKFSLKQCIHKLKISKFPLLSNKHCVYMQNGCSTPAITDIARHAILECWVFWFFTHLVSPLVQANFYVTESEHERQEVIYYRKSTWEKLMKEAECMKDKRYSLINLASVRKILAKRPFGFSRARLRPKKIGFRMLANLQAPSRMPTNLPPRIHSNQKLQRKGLYNQVKYQYFKSVNSVLHDLHVVLKGLFTQKPEKFGSSVFDYNDVYKKLVPFLLLLKNGSTSMPSVFIVVADVWKAFDSVSHDKLLSVMKDVILDDEYTLEKFVQVICTKRSLKVHQHLTLANQDIAPASAKIVPWLPAQSFNGVLVKKELSRKMRKEEINLLLKEHIKRNVVQLDNNFYLQQVGIPQGSVLSTLLCSIYYEHMERNVVFPFLEKVNKVLSGEYDTLCASSSVDNHTEEMVEGRPKYLLLRFIDDFLFISTSKKQASMFFSRLERGIRDYNCCMNEEKFGLNFKLDNGEASNSKRLYIGRDDVSFLRWSGLLVNCSTLEIQADYTRYQNTHLSSTLTVSCKGKVGRHLKEKLRSFLLPKCHPLFYDSNINSPGVVRLNIYQAFLLCAMKFVCYISKLSILPRFSPEFYINAIGASLRYMSRLIKRKMYSFKLGNGFRPKYDVREKDVVWLGWYAYRRVLNKKQSSHKKLLRLIRSKLKAYGTAESMSPELKYAVDDAHSSVLWRIKY